MRKISKHILQSIGEKPFEEYKRLYKEKTKKEYKKTTDSPEIWNTVGTICKEYGIPVDRYIEANFKAIKTYTCRPQDLVKGGIKRFSTHSFGKDFSSKLEFDEQGFLLGVCEKEFKQKVKEPPRKESEEKIVVVANEVTYTPAEWAILMFRRLEQAAYLFKIINPSKLSWFVSDYELVHPIVRYAYACINKLPCESELLDVVKGCPKKDKDLYIVAFSGINAQDIGEEDVVKTLKKVVKVLST